VTPDAGSAAAERRLLDEQLAYYRARAAEYDQWWFREGRFDHGPAHRAAWLAEVATLEAAFRAAGPHGEALELACGTGLWTRHLAAVATRVTAVDASPEVIALNRARVASARVDYVLADVFAWTPDRAYDFVLFTFWISHVPPARFEEFWALVRRALRPGGRVFFADNLRPAPGPPAGATVERRRLNDGREFDIVKVYHDPPALERRLAALGWHATVTTTPRFFIHGTATAAA
jgi:SAM-dependent methyltransferase